MFKVKLLLKDPYYKDTVTLATTELRRACIQTTVVKLLGECSDRKKEREASGKGHSEVTREMDDFSTLLNLMRTQTGGPMVKIHQQVRTTTK
jgi:hypothetical protein